MWISVRTETIRYLTLTSRLKLIQAKKHEYIFMKTVKKEGQNNPVYHDPNLVSSILSDLL